VRRRARNQQRDDWMCKACDGHCLGDVTGSPALAHGSWSKTQNLCPGHTVRVRPTSMARGLG